MGVVGFAPGSGWERPVEASSAVAVTTTSSPSSAHVPGTAGIRPSGWSEG